MKKLLIFMMLSVSAFAQMPPSNPYNANTLFEQMGQALPTPNTYRNASGAPGKEYWQQKADYDIKVELDDDKQHITSLRKKSPI